MAQSNTVITLPRSLATKAKAKVATAGFDNGSVIPKPSQLYQSQTIRSLRNQGQIAAALRRLARTDGTVSAAVSAYVQIANSGYKVKAYDNNTHELSAEGTLLARSVIANMDMLTDYTEKFSDKRSINSLVESALQEVVITGAVAGELVLNKQRLPDRIALVPYEQLNYVSRNPEGQVYPEQQPSQGDKVPLNIATFWVAEGSKQANVAYATSMLEACLPMSEFFIEAVEDMRRAVRRTGHTRLIVKLLSEKITAAAPTDIQSDPVKLKAWMEAAKADVTSVINSLEPEDSLVCTDALEVDSVRADGEKADYTPLISTISGMLATSLKSHPSILGLRLTGSQSLSNTESLVFLKISRALQVPLEQFFSRAMTLATRLYGSDVYVKFQFNPIDLRPESELSAFKTMEQQRILELLSLGFLSDEAAAEQLGTGTRPAGAPPLSGTMFQVAKTADANAVNLKDGAQERKLQSDQPTKAGGKSN